MDKIKLTKEIEELQTEINHKEAMIKRFDDELQVSKGHKHFLDVLAIQAGLKAFTPSLKKFARHVDDDGGSTAHATGMVPTRQMTRGGDQGNTFMTQVSSPSKKTIKDDSKSSKAVPANVLKKKSLRNVQDGS